MKKLELENISILDEEKIFQYLFGKKLRRYRRNNNFSYTPSPSCNQLPRRRIRIGAVFNTYGGKATKMYEIYTVGIDIENPTEKENYGKIWIKNEKTVQRLREKILNLIRDDFDFFVKRNKTLLNEYAYDCFKNNGGVKSLVMSTGCGYSKVFIVKKEDLNFMKKNFFNY